VSGENCCLWRWCLSKVAVKTAILLALLPVEFSVLEVESTGTVAASDAELVMDDDKGDYDDSLVLVHQYIYPPSYLYWCWLVDIL